MTVSSAPDEAVTWCEIDLDAYAHNLRELQRICRSGARLMAVVKADGYGHGAIRLARTAVTAGAAWLGVARLHEAIELRDAGLELPILVFGDPPTSGVRQAVDRELSFTLVDEAAAERFSREAKRLGVTLRCHLKVDSGMGRVGLVTGHTPVTEIADRVQVIERLPGLAIEGIYTHFATADHEERGYANAQVQRFTELLDELERRGVEVGLRHAANSAALITLPESHLDLVRPGIATYGLWPSREIRRDDVDLRPVLTWKTRIAQIKDVPSEFAVGYGLTWRSDRATRLATLSVGYADGLDRHLSSGGQVLVRGQRARVVGRVSMDLTVIDVGDVPEAAAGDEVILCGRQGDEELTVDEMATTLGTISYEIVSRIAPRVPRFYRG